MPTHYLIDENLPRSLAQRLRAVGLGASDVREEGLRGHPDSEILEYAVARSLVLVTGDLGFGGLLRSSPAANALIITRLPDEWPASVVNELLVKVLKALALEELTGFLTVIEPHRVRRRKIR